METLLRAGTANGSRAATENPRAAAIALFGSVNISALTYLVADDEVNEDLVARTIHDVLFVGLRPR